MLKKNLIKTKNRAVSLHSYGLLYDSVRNHIDTHASERGHAALDTHEQKWAVAHKDIALRVTLHFVNALLAGINKNMSSYFSNQIVFVFVFIFR